MLTTLSIKNLALIENAEIKFGAGLNILTGETGAGKSIVLGALNFILGAKLGKHMVRSGESLAKVTAVFEQGEEELILTRILKSDGKGECRINGEIVSVVELKELAGGLIDIHGQHDTARLLDSKTHTDVLDGFGDYQDMLAEFKQLAGELRDLKKQLESFGSDESERARLIDLYDYQIKEIERANLRDGEEEELSESRTRMLNHEKIAVNLTQAIEALSTSQLRRAVAALSSVSNIDTDLGKLYEEAESVVYSLGAVESGLSEYLGRSEYDEREFTRVDARLDEIKALKRKYGASIRDILLFLDETRAKYERHTNSEKEIQALGQAIDAQKLRIADCQSRLTAARQSTATEFEKQLLDRLRPLGMQSATFTCKITDTGAEFMFSANLGEPLRALSSVISGGELSRFMLALKSLVADNFPTVVFDEIDTGIGGDIGRKIGERLRELSTSRQVIAVTHLSQIATLADHHFFIKKQADGARTSTTIRALDTADRKTELQRMVG